MNNNTVCSFCYILSLLFVFGIFLSCSNSSMNSTEQSQSILHRIPDVEKPNRIWKAGFLIMDGVYNSELIAPMDVLQHTIFHAEPGIEVFTIAKDTSVVTSFEGLKILPDYSYHDTFPLIDILIVPSAEHHLDTDLEDLEMLEFVKETASSAKYVMSLCDGAFVLAEAGLLKGVASTTFPGDITLYRSSYPELEVYENVLFVHDQKFITSAGGAKSFEPALYLTELLYGKKVAEGIGRGLVIDWNLEDMAFMVKE